jgi:16S rRNA (cytosine967-C5)-methyltransferase
VTGARRTRPRRGRPDARGPRRGAASPTQVRLTALRVLQRVDQGGAYADLALRAALARSPLGAGDRALVTELVYGTLRWRGRLDFLLSCVLDRDFGKLELQVATLLRLGAYQVLFAERIPAPAAVDQTVRCARAVGADRAAGLVNAVLRRLAAQREALALPGLETDPLGHLTHALSLPSWLAARWLARLGPAEAAALAAASNAVPPLVARANPRRTTRDALLAELRARFPDAEPARLAPLGVRLGHRGDPGRDPAFVEGRFTLQDEGSQLVVELLAPVPGERVLDVCAAPGTKATAIAERVGDAGRVVALDRNARRLHLVGRDARRLGLPNLGIAVFDATRALDPVAPPGSFDRVLVDAPCSGLGTLRRNPDLRWRLREGDPAHLAETQRALLRRAAAALRPGGALVYSTCTLLTEENEAVVDAFLAETPAFRRAPADAVPAPVRPLIEADGALRTWPHRHDADGFYAARLERTA